MEANERKVWSDGLVRLDQVSGSDEYICRIARSTAGTERNKLPEDDKGLIRYLVRHMHSTPVEFGEAVFFLRIQMDAWRQMVRHRTASINEYSTRYRPAIDEAFALDPDQWRLQSKTNRQGSSGGVVEFKTPGQGAWPAGYTIKAVKDHTPEAGPDGTSDWVFDPTGGLVCSAKLTPGEYLSQRQAEVQTMTREVYEERVALGVAFEVARKDLPLSTYTELYWKCDLNNIFRFLSLRMHAHAQKEIREYAEAMYDLLKPHFPMLFEAFDDFDPRRGGLLLSRLDVEVIQKMLGHLIPDPSHPDLASLWQGVQPAYWTEFEQWQRDQGRKTIRVGERDECLEKLKRLGIVPPTFSF